MPRNGTDQTSGVTSLIDAVDGAFSFTQVLPGSYALTAIIGESQSAPSGRWRLVPLNVGNADITDVRIAITAGIDLPGKVLIEGFLSPRPDNAEPGRIIAALLTGSNGQFGFMNYPRAVYASQGPMEL